MKQLHLEQNSQEWLDARKKYRTASEAAIVMGISPFTTPDNFKLIKAGVKKQYYSAAMKQGHDLEDIVRQRSNKHFKRDFKDECWANGDYMASLDGIDGDTLVELKVSDRTYRDLKDGITPDYYYAQVQQQLYCSPAKYGYIVAYSPKADDIAVSDLIELDYTFMQRVSEAWDKFDAMPVPQVADLSEDNEVVSLFNDYESLKDQADKIKAQMDDVKMRLVERADDRSILASGFKLTRGKPRVTYDYKRAATKAGVDLEQYRKESEGAWTITMPRNPFL
jgi:putative phage-type endonuclease